MQAASRALKEALPETRFFPPAAQYMELSGSVLWVFSGLRAVWSRAACLGVRGLEEIEAGIWRKLLRLRFRGRLLACVQLWLQDCRFWFW